MREQQLRSRDLSLVRELFKSIKKHELESVLDGFDAAVRRDFCGYKSKLDHKTMQGHVDRKRLKLNAGLPRNAALLILNREFFPRDTMRVFTENDIIDALLAKIPIWAALPQSTTKSITRSEWDWEQVHVIASVYYNPNLGKNLRHLNAKRAAEKSSALKKTIDAAPATQPAPPTADIEWAPKTPNCAHHFVVVQPVSARPIFAAPARGLAWYVLPIWALRV